MHPLRALCSLAFLRTAGHRSLSAVLMALVLLAGLSAPTLALAQQQEPVFEPHCIEEAAARIGSTSLYVQDLEADALRPLFDELVDSQESYSNQWMEYLSGCVEGSWHFRFSLPSIADIIDNLIRAVVRQACSLIRREVVGRLDGAFSHSFYLNSPIPGMGRVGVGIGGGGGTEGFFYPSAPASMDWDAVMKQGAGEGEQP